MSEAQPGHNRPSGEPEPIDVTPLIGYADGEESQPPAARSRRRTIVLGALLALSVAAAAVFATTGWRVVREKDAALATPDRIAGLERDDGQAAQETADYLRDALAAEVDLTTSVGAVYADPASAARSVLIFGGTALLWRPAESLDKALGLLSDDSGRVEEIRDVPSGKLGGVTKCGTARSQDDDIAVCGWADHGSIAIVMFPGRQLDESGQLLLAIREDMQSRS